MSDTPTPLPSASPPTDPAPPAPRPRRPWTILGRLTEAVREQNWFAVVLEVLIVIVGVVVGFQVTGWGQARADRVQEQHYLRQLVEDLKLTEQTYQTMEPDWSLRDASVGALLRSFRTASPPPADSVIVWATRATVINRPSIVTSTADALVQTGDINLIRDDSLRSSITYYIDQMDIERSHLEHIDEEARPFVFALTERVDFVDGNIKIWLGRWLGKMPPARRDSLAREWPLFPMPEGPHRTIMPLDVEALFRDQAAYTAVSNIWRLRTALEFNRGKTIAATVALREKIEAELDR